MEVVLSTDGVEPLYFITADDLTYQAKCPLKTHKKISQNNNDDQRIQSNNERNNEYFKDKYKFFIALKALTFLSYF